ncbi:hypothetical protein GCM10022239_09770 [Leifsonia bigeumensis]|uniref:DUF7847 domain-containing protein n=1 Tax=Leifsonella bigeumensis TaxID=433643 RepID=A0ABP7FH96_9MICO
MTDDQAWQAPGGPPPVVPGYGPPAAPVYGPPQPAPGYGPPPPAPGQGAPGQPAAGWTPPPKPGLIPLRPLDLGTLLGASFRTLRRNPRPTFGIALLVQGIVSIVTLFAVGLPVLASILRLDTAAQEDQSAIVAGTFATAAVTALLAVCLSLVANAWLQGIIVLEVSRATLGEKLTLRGLWGHAKGRIGALVGWSVLIAVVLALTIGVFVAVIWIMVATLGAVGVGLGVLVGILGVLALIVVGAWIGTKLSLVPSVIMLERLTIGGSMRRSWTLTNGYFWKTFGIQLLAYVILSVAGSIVTAPFSIITPILVYFVDPNGTGSGYGIAIALIAYVVQLLVTLVVAAVTAIIQTAVTALIYLDLRMRKEGLDLALAKFVEARQAGAAGLADPYLRDQQAA